MQLLRKIQKQGHTLHAEALADFCRQMGRLLRRGRSPSECFAAMAGRADSPAGERMCLEMRQYVQNDTVSGAMRKTDRKSVV